MIKTFQNEIFAKVRSTGKLLKSKIKINNNDDAVLSLQEDEYGISPGQACVFYSKDQHGYKVLGGGWIKKIISFFAFFHIKKVNK